MDEFRKQNPFREKRDRLLRARLQKNAFAVTYIKKSIYSKTKQLERQDESENKIQWFSAQRVAISYGLMNYFVLIWIQMKDQKPRRVREKGVEIVQIYNKPHNIYYKYTYYM